MASCFYFLRELVCSLHLYICSRNGGWQGRDRQIGKDYISGYLDTKQLPVYIQKTALFIRSDMCYNGPEQKRPASGGLPGETPDHTKRKK